MDDISKLSCGPMKPQSHFFIPESDSLESRIQALKEVLQAHSNIEISMAIAKNEGWQQRLGTEEELQAAKEITERSLAAATRKISQSDFSNAQELGLLSTNDIDQFKVIKAKSDLSARRRIQQTHQKSIRKP